MQRWIIEDTDTVVNYFTQKLLEDERVSFASYKRCHFLEKKQNCEIVVETEEPIAVNIFQNGHHSVALIFHDVLKIHRHNPSYESWHVCNESVRHAG